MDNRAALAEIARVVRPGGYVFLKTHHPGFYLKMIGRALNDRNPKAVVYPALCLIGGTISVLGRRHPRPAFFRKREVFQTDRMLDREFKKNGFRIVRMMPDSTAENRSYLLEKL
jgi:ubiquinone/menaquinone biosynthesis C-methylase UbiE